MNTKQILVGTKTRLYLPHYGCRRFWKNSAQPCSFQVEAPQETTFSLQQFRSNWIQLFNTSGPTAPRPQPLGMCQESCRKHLSLCFRGAGGRKTATSVTPYLWELSWEHLGSTWPGERGLPWAVGAHPSVGASGLSCSESRPRQPSVCEAGRQECDRPAWWWQAVPGGSGRRVGMWAGGRDLPWAFGSHRSETTSFCSWPGEELMRWRQCLEMID